MGDIIIASGNLQLIKCLFVKKPTKPFKGQWRK